MTQIKGIKWRPLAGHVRKFEKFAHIKSWSWLGSYEFHGRFHPSQFDSLIAAFFETLKNCETLKTCSKETTLEELPGSMGHILYIIYVLTIGQIIRSHQPGFTWNSRGFPLFKGCRIGPFHQAAKPWFHQYRSSLVPSVNGLFPKMFRGQICNLAFLS